MLIDIFSEEVANRMSRKKILMIGVPSLLLAAGGYAYYYFIGCHTGT